MTDTTDRLTDYDRRSIAESRMLEAVELDAAAVREFTGDDDDAMAWPVFAARLQYHLRDLLAIIDRDTDG